MTYPFLKGHGTENDFVLLPDHDGSVHGPAGGVSDETFAARVRALCDRRAGIGGDGVLRVVHGEQTPDGSGAGWFMDYRNADGSPSEMCGNGVRVFALHLVQEGLVAAGEAVPIGTRDGIKVVTVHDADRITVDMGTARVLGETTVSLGGRRWPARHLDLGNPHAVAWVDQPDQPDQPDQTGGGGLDLADLSAPGQPLDQPGYDAAVYPHGVNIELVVRRGPHHVAMRVHERGVGETRSCGTGACAVMVAAALADGAPAGTAYQVDVPGGSLSIALDGDRVLMTGPAVVVARGETGLETGVVDGAGPG